MVRFMAQVIAVTSGKGGAGKSSMCVGIGTALARAGNSVLIIELDCGLRGLDLMLGSQDEIVYDLGDLLSGGCEVEQAITVSGVHERLALIAAPASHHLAFQIGDLELLCAGLKKGFDVVLLDLPAGLGLSAGLTGRLADRLLVVATPDPVCIRDGGRLVSLLSGEGPKKRHLLINRASYKGMKKGLVRDLDDVIDGVGLPLIGVIPDDEAITLCFGNGKPLPPDSLPAAAFRNIAARLMGEYRPLAVQ